MSLSSSERPQIEASIALNSNPIFNNGNCRFRSNWSRPNGITVDYPSIQSWEEDTFSVLRTAYRFMDNYRPKDDFSRPFIPKSRQNKIRKKIMNHPLLTNIVSKTEYFSRKNFSARTFNYALAICKVRILKDLTGFSRILLWIDEEIKRITPFEDHYRALLLSMQCEIYVHLYHSKYSEHSATSDLNLMEDIENHLYTTANILRAFVASEIKSLTSREGNDSLFNASYLVNRVIIFIEDISIQNRKLDKLFSAKHHGVDNSKEIASSFCTVGTRESIKILEQSTIARTKSNRPVNSLIRSTGVL